MERLLSQFAGPTGFQTVIGAALVGDVMMYIQPCIRLEDGHEGDLSLLGGTAAKIRDDLRDMLQNGSIFLAQSTGTLVHAALEAMMKDQVVFFQVRSGTSAVALGWPSGDRLANPARQAKELYKLFLAYFDQHFPSFEIQNAFAAFDVESNMDMVDRRVLLDSLCTHMGKDKEKVWRAFVGGIDYEHNNIYRSGCKPIVETEFSCRDFGVFGGWGCGGSSDDSEHNRLYTQFHFVQTEIPKNPKIAREELPGSIPDASQMRHLRFLDGAYSTMISSPRSLPKNACSMMPSPDTPFIMLPPSDAPCPLLSFSHPF